jgi:hypothetical protein
MNGLQRLAIFGLAVGGLMLGSDPAQAQWRARVRWQAPMYSPWVDVRPAAPATQFQATTPAAQFRTDQAIHPAGHAAVQIPRASAMFNSHVSLSGARFPGRIVDFVIDDLGCIKHVVISHENRFVMLPYQLVRFDAAQNVVHVNIQADRFRQAPTFTHWSMMADPRFMEQVNTFFGVSAKGDFRIDQRGPDGLPIQTPGIQQQQQLKQPQQLPQPQQQQQLPQQPQLKQPQQQTTPPNDPNRPPDQQQISTPPIIPPNGQGNERIPDE